MITLTAQVVGTEAVVANLGKMSATIHERIARAVRKSAVEVQGAVKENLNDVILKRRSGHLGGSITTRDDDSGNEIKSLVGTNIEYGRYHELGFNGSESVRAHVVNRKSAFGRKTRPYSFTMPEHSRKVNYAGRPFLVPTLNAMAPTIRKRIAGAVGGK